MESRWDTSVAAGLADAIGECVYCTRLIGADPSLVLHGGGNSSVKAPYADITGRSIDALHVKGSGWDMATIERAGLTPLPLDRLHDLLGLGVLSDTDMMRELASARLDPGAPNPSVETLLHAYLPHAAVQHSHADVIVTVTNTPASEKAVREIYGDSVVVIPYVMPGFDLARMVVQEWPRQAHADTVGMVLLNHGLFTFGDTSLVAYERHVELISRAEEWLDARGPRPSGGGAALPATGTLLRDLADLRRRMSEAAGGPLVVQRHVDEDVSRFVGRSDVADLATRGPLTPDHVIRTKRVPMVGRDVDAYVADYQAYVAEHAADRPGLTPLDPAPRLVLDRALGLLTAGRTVKDAQIAADIYHHTIPVLERAEDHLGGYRALPAADIFAVEYWSLEQAKLALGGRPAELAGRVALVTGAASGIGRACAAALLAAGACVVGMDRDPGIEDTFSGAAWTGQVVDVQDPAAQRSAVERSVERYGGLDHVVVSAGAFGASRPIAELTRDEWRAVMAVNVDAVADLLAAVHPLLALSPVAASVVLIGSKNVPAPGRGAAAYSASKAALTQLGRIAALEWAEDGIRVNAVHPDAVFDTALWTPELITERAERYGLTVDEYKRRNLLGAEVTSERVAAAVLALCGDTFACTTGAQVPIDGGNERVI